MKPPFYGNKIVSDISLDEIYPLIDTRSLFVGRWQFKRTKASEDAYQEILKLAAWPAFEEWKKRCKDENILRPKVAYGYFNGPEVRDALKLSNGPSGLAPLQLVTVGEEVVKRCQWLFAAHKYTDYLYLHGLAVEATEALAELWHKRMLRELKVAFNAGRPMPKMSRISPGYQAWPDLSAQKEIVRLLDAEKIGVTLTEAYQLVPEYSTSAMIIL